MKTSGGGARFRKWSRKVQDFDWDVKTRGFLLSVFYYGFILTNIPGGIFAIRYGGAKLFGYGIILTSITTLFTPVLARVHLYMLIALRVFEGMCEGVLDPSMELLLSNWIPLQERSSVIAVVVSGNHLGHIVGVAASGAIGFYWGWEAIFYCTGSVGVVWFIAALMFVKEQPANDSKVLISELEYIQRSCKGSAAKRKVSDIPYMKIITSLPVWAIVLTHFIASWSHMFAVTQFPAFIKDVLKFDYKNSGYLSSLPFIFKILASYLLSPVADILTTKKILTISAARKIFICVGMLMMATFGFLVQQTTSTVLVIVCLTIIVVSSVICHVQMLVNILDIAPGYSSLLAGLISTTFSLNGIINPTVTGYLTQNKTAEEWHTVFSIQAGLCLLGALIYGVFASGQLQPWAVENKRRTLEENANNIRS